MRIPLTPHGYGQLAVLGGACVAGAAGPWFWPRLPSLVLLLVGLMLLLRYRVPVYAAAFLFLAVAAWFTPVAGSASLIVLAIFLVSFFRDPERTPPGGPEVAVAPADGRIADIEEVDEPEVIGGRALRIGIFLSVFDVHVNRAPLDGTLTYVRYSPGRFLDVRDPDCITQNEANLAGFRGPHGVFAVRQIAGLVARRIVFPFREGDDLTRGQRMGMIKFGSRTELFVPASAPVEVEVVIGQMVKGAETVLLRFTG